MDDISMPSESTPETVGRRNNIYHKDILGEKGNINKLKNITYTVKLSSVNTSLKRWMEESKVI